MDTKHLITFLTFCREKSYLRAAQELNYAPSTLSEHIASLESELKIKLIESRGKRSILTKAGEQFIPYAKQMMDIYQTALQDLSVMNTISGNLCIMSVESLGLYSMSSVFAGFMRRYPNITLSINIGNWRQILEKLKKGEIDIGYLYDMKPVELPEFDTRILFKEKLKFAVSPRHPLAGKKKIRPADFRMQTFILAQKDCYYSRTFSQMLKKHEVKIKAKFELDSGNLIKQYACSGLGIALLPSTVIKKELEEHLLTCLDLDFPEWDIWAQSITVKKEWMMPAVTELLQESEDAFAQASVS